MESKDMMTVNVNVDITTETLKAIVENAKQLTGRDEKGVYKVDTADKVSEMISKFLMENNFETYAKDIGNMK